MQEPSIIDHAGGVPNWMTFRGVARIFGQVGQQKHRWGQATSHSRRQGHQSIPKSRGGGGQTSTPN